MLVTSIRTWLLVSTHQRPARKRSLPTSLKGFAMIKRKCSQISRAMRSKRSLLLTEICSISKHRQTGTTLCNKKGSDLRKREEERKEIHHDILSSESSYTAIPKPPIGFEYH